jgi:hypothetical protein
MLNSHPTAKTANMSSTLIQRTTLPGDMTMMMPSTTPASPASPASLAAAISLLDLATSDVGADFTLARQRISAARDILLGRGLEQPRLPAGGLAPGRPSA